MVKPMHERACNIERPRPKVKPELTDRRAEDDAGDVLVKVEDDDGATVKHGR